MNEKGSKGEIALLLGIFTAVLVWSGVDPYDRYTWALEVAPAIGALVVLAATYRRFPLTPMAYRLILVHAVVLMVGGKYTYARVPAFDWIRDAFEMSRNNYDKLGHFAQGFIPAIVVREVLVRTSPVKRGAWLSFVVVSVCLAMSAFYEFIEWWVAVVSGTAAESFLGTQGYAWDTQSDMLMALIGAVAALLLLSRAHDRALEKAGWLGRAGLRGL